MVRTTEDVVRRSFVRHLRADTDLDGLFTGEFEDFAPRGTAYPFLTYGLVTAPYVDDWTKRTIRSWWDISVWSEDQVEAGTLDAQVMTSLEDSVVSIEVDIDPGAGVDMQPLQSILYCRRIAGLRSKETTDEGKTVYRIGGTYSMWSDQPL